MERHISMMFESMDRRRLTTMKKFCQGFDNICSNISSTLTAFLPASNWPELRSLEKNRVGVIMVSSWLDMLAITMVVALRQQKLQKLSNGHHARILPKRGRLLAFACIIEFGLRISLLSLNRFICCSGKVRFSFGKVRRFERWRYS